MSFKKDFMAGWKFWDKILETLPLFSSRPKSRNLSVSRSQRELQKLYEEISVCYQQSEISNIEPCELAVDLLIKACEEVKITPVAHLLSPFYDTVLHLMGEDGLLGIEEIDFDIEYPFSEQLEIRKELFRLKRIYSLDHEYLDAWLETLTLLFVNIFNSLPKSMSFDKNETGSFNMELIHFVEYPSNLVEYILALMFDEDVEKMGLFPGLSNTLYRNNKEFSGIISEEDLRKKKLIHPMDSGLSAGDLVSNYLKNTPFQDIFSQQFKFAIPKSSRFEHCHIVGGTGHGKTQLIQSLILEDLNASDGRGLCTIDSQGDLINKLSLLSRFDPEIKDSLSDKLVIIDPTDIDYPVCLNMFAMNDRIVEGMSAVNKEMLLNATVDLYSYMFGALFGAELTMRQGVIFNYIARLMMEIPNATIQTLRELMEDGRKFIPYMEKLKGSSRAFFQTQFFSSSFGQTKKQVLSRLWGVLSNATLERMFSNTENRIDLYEAMNSGKIVLINTAKSLLGRDGSQILGRFFIALLGQAFLKRSAISEDKRKPFFVYIDEAHEYFDERLNEQLNQARKYKVGLTLAHQNLDQLGSSLKATIMSSTSVKFAGGVSSQDAIAIARETRSTPESILDVRKRGDHTEFACWIKNVTQGMIKLNVPFGLLEIEPVLSESSYSKLIEQNREKYCVRAETINLDDSSPFTIKPEAKKRAGVKEKLPSTPKEKSPHVSIKPEQKPPDGKEKSNVTQALAKNKTIVPPKSQEPKTGKGGPQHRYIQNLVRRFAQERGYKAIVEQQVFDGAGSVDVSLEGYGEKIACEISVTTDAKWETQNIAKCLTAGYTKVVVLASENKHLHKLRNAMSESFAKEIEEEKILFCLPDGLITYLDQKRAESATEEKTVRGYKVKVNYSAVSAQDEEMKKEAIAKVILQSMRKM